jgi:drug/metabolite transporter (DMT)-like permease
MESRALRGGGVANSSVSPFQLFIFIRYTALVEPVKSTRLFLLTFAALACFAANSLLCRLALKRTTIDPLSFTSIRIVAGAIVLWLILKWRGQATRNAGSWISAMALFGYASAFSLAYLSLAAGTGALLLFAAVQATMILGGFQQGERLRVRQGLGLVLAAAGLVLLLLPGLSAPSFGGSILMLGAGAAWGVYSLRGKTAGDPARATAGNFMRATPVALSFSIAGLHWLRLDWLGIEYAMISGAVTSGLGYVIWYAVLTELKATSAATVQLSVPVLAASGGILFLGESISLRFFLSSVAVLGGIALVIIGKGQTVTLAQED